MEDPLPENIAGEKRVTHSVNHHINWGYALLGLAGLVTVLKFGPPLLDSSSVDVGQEDEEIEASAEWVDVEPESLS